MSTSLGNLFIPIRAVTDTFRSDVDKAAADAGASAGSKFSSTFSAGIAKVSLGGLATGFAAATAGLVELDSATQRYRATTGATQADVEKMQRAALDLNRNNLVSISQISDVLATLRTDLGLTQDQADKAAQSFLNYAKVTGQDGVGAVKAFDDILDAWGLTAADATGIMDQLVASHQKYGGSIEENQAALAGLGPRLKALGVDVNQAIGLLNLFASSGLKADQATGALNVAVTKLKPGQNLGDLVSQIQAIADPTQRAQAAIELFGAKGGVAIANLQGNFKDFEVAPAAAAGAVDKASDQINDSLTTKAQLAIKNVTGAALELAQQLGPVATGAVASISLITAAFDAMKVSAIAGWLATLGPVALAAGAGAAFLLLLDNVTKTADAEVAAAQAAGDLTGAQAALKAQLDAGTIGLDDYDSKLDSVQHNQYLQAEAAARAAGADAAAAAAAGKAAVAADKGTAAAKSNTGATNTNARATDNLTGATGDHTDATLAQLQAIAEAAQAMKAAGLHAGALAGTTSKATQEFIANTLAARETGAGLDNVQAAAIAGANALDRAGASAPAAGNDASRAAVQFASLANAIAHTNRTKAIQTGTGPGAEGPGFTEYDNPSLPGMSIDDYHALEIDYKPYTPTAAHGGGGGGAGGKSQATKDAEALAKALHDKVVAAYEEAKKAGDAWYASIHDSKSKAVDDFHDLSRERIDTEHEVAKATIEDAHRVAKEQFDAERQSIRDRLTERRKLNAEPVTAAEKALQDVQNERRLRDLNEQLAAAQQGVDPKALRSAQEALSDFMAQQNIDLLRDQQAAADVQAEADAKAADDDLDTRIKAEDTLHEKQLAEEDARYKVRVDAEDKRYKLAQHDEDVRSQRQIAKFDEHIAAMDDSKKATVALAQAETKRFLQEQLKLAKESGTAQDVRFAQADLDAFLKSLPHKAAGGWVGMKGPELVIEGEDGPEYVVPRASGNSVMQFARGAASAASGQTTNIEVTINNPSPEPASRSAERPLRQIAAGLFG